MNDLSAGPRAELDQRIRTHDDQVDKDLNTLRQLDEQWDTYRREMRANVERFEEAAYAVGVESYCARTDLAALREVGAYAEKLAQEENELCVEVSRTIPLDGEAEIARLRVEQGGLPWD